MISIVIDTSHAIVVAVVKNESVVAQQRSATGRQHAELLSPLLAQALADADMTARVVDHVVVGTGPAPFTGLRAGLVAARTFGFARCIPVLGVCSLDALALSAMDQVGIPALETGNATIAVLTDARRKEVYGRRYRVVKNPNADTDHPYAAWDVKPVDEPWVARPRDVVEDLRDCDSVVAPTPLAVLDGSGVTLSSDQISLDPLALVTAALRNRDAGDPTSTEPLYLRRPDAQVPGPAKRPL